LNDEGPGHSPLMEVPAQSEDQRQFPFGQTGLVQHFTSEGSEGQAPEMEVPPEEEQSEVLTQTPGSG
jgi:hypothetical protein